MTQDYITEFLERNNQSSTNTSVASVNTTGNQLKDIIGRFYDNNGDNSQNPLFSLSAYFSCVAREAYRIWNWSQYPGNSKAGDKLGDAKGKLAGLEGLGQNLGIPPEDIENAKGKWKKGLGLF